MPRGMRSPGIQNCFERRKESMAIINTTLCYLEKDGCYLMLYRNKKKNDPCEGKWVSPGGKFEPGEDSEACVLREVKEETGLTLTEYEKRGVVHFQSDVIDDEEMYLYTATAWEGEITDCNEGTLRWIPLNEVLDLNLWEGDPYFLKPLIEGERDIELTCRYRGDDLVYYENHKTGETLHFEPSI